MWEAISQRYWHKAKLKTGMGSLNRSRCVLTKFFWHGTRGYLERTSVLCEEIRSFVTRVLSTNLCSHLLQHLHQIHNAFVQRPISHSQNLLTPGIVRSIATLFWKAIIRLPLIRESSGVLGKFLLDDIRDHLVREVALGADEEPFTPSSILLKCGDVCLGDVSDISPQEDTTVGEPVLELPADKVQRSLSHPPLVSLSPYPSPFITLTWLLGFKLSRLDMYGFGGPTTSGGLIVAILKFGFSFSTKSHAAFSANFFETRYPLTGSLKLPREMGFQSSSL